MVPLGTVHNIASELLAVNGIVAESLTHSCGIETAFKTHYGGIEMEAAKMHVMLDIKDEFKRNGMDNAAIADANHKDKSTVDKQFAEKNGTQTLLTAYGYAESLGGRVVFMLDEEWDRLHGLEQAIHDLKDELRDRDQRLSIAN